MKPVDHWVRIGPAFTPWDPGRSGDALEGVYLGAWTNPERERDGILHVVHTDAMRLVTVEWHKDAEATLWPNRTGIALLTFGAVVPGERLRLVYRGTLIHSTPEGAYGLLDAEVFLSVPVLPAATARDA